MLQPRRVDSHTMPARAPRASRMPALGRAQTQPSKIGEPGAAATTGGDTMSMRSIRLHVTIATVAAAAALAAIIPVRAGGDKVAYPENHAAGVLFTTVDRADNKQFREFYTSAAALDAARKGEPLPSGTVITMVQYAAKLDSQGKSGKGRQRPLHQGQSPRLRGD